MIQMNNTNNTNNKNNKIFYINIMLKILLLISIIFLCLSLNKNKNKNKEGFFHDDDGCKWIPAPTPECSLPSGTDVITELVKQVGNEYTPCTPSDENDNESCESCGTSPTPTPTPIIETAKWIESPGKCDGPSSCPGKTEDDCGSYNWTLIGEIGGGILGVIVIISLLSFALKKSKSKQMSSDGEVIMNPILESS
jgi:hypothetical protein